jgi:hypothetical protein
MNSSILPRHDLVLVRQRRQIVGIAVMPMRSSSAAQAAICNRCVRVRPTFKDHGLSERSTGMIIEVQATADVQAVLTLMVYRA